MNQQFVNAINLEIASLPESFFGTFQYTRTGNNLCHPLTLGVIARVVADLPAVSHVGIDIRLNQGSGIKFQPDVVGFDKDIHPVLAVDYESPNSSDARIPVKDWLSFANWRKVSGQVIPYFVITTLPDFSSPEWQLRWTASDQYNHAFRGQRTEIQSNPFKFWYKHYRLVAPKYDLKGIYMVNISAGIASIVEIDRI